MKKILLSATTATALLATSLLAQAADLPQKAYAPAPVMVAAVYDWTGFYIGGNGGFPRAPQPPGSGPPARGGAPAPGPPQPRGVPGVPGTYRPAGRSPG